MLGFHQIIITHPDFFYIILNVSQIEPGVKVFDNPIFQNELNGKSLGPDLAESSA